MSSNRPHRGVMVLLMVLLLLTLMPGGIRPEDVAAKNTYTVNKHTITITVPVVLIGRNGSAAVAFHVKAFNAVWGKPGGFKHGCFTVIFKLDIKVSQNEEAGRHTVFRVPLDRGQVWTSEAGRYPGDASYTVYTSERDSGQTLVHEYGHVLGLRDEYTEHFTNGRRSTRPDPNKAPEYQTDSRGNVVLKPGETRSIMAERGQVLPRHIETIVKRHVPPEKLKCNWRGSVDIGVAVSDPTGLVTETVLMSFTMEEDDAGVLEGTGSATITVDASGTTDCGTWMYRSEPMTVDIAVSGQRTDDTMSLLFEALGDTQAVVTGTACGATIADVVEVRHLFDIPGWAPLTQQGDTFVFDDHIPYTGGESWLVINVEPAEVEGAPVG